MSVYKYNEKEVFCESFNLNGMRDVPKTLRPSFERMMLETFAVGREDTINATPLSFEYGRGEYLHEDLFYLHSLTVYFAYWVGDVMETDYIEFLL